MGEEKRRDNDRIKTPLALPHHKVLSFQPHKYFTYSKINEIQGDQNQQILKLNITHINESYCKQT